MGISPTAVAFIRGAIEAAVLAVITLAITWLTSASVGNLAPYAPLAVLALRQLEGIVDTKIDPTKQRVLGGANHEGPVNV